MRAVDLTCYQVTFLRPVTYNCLGKPEGGDTFDVYVVTTTLQEAICEAVNEVSGSIRGKGASVDGVQVICRGVYVTIPE